MKRCLFLVLSLLIVLSSHSSSAKDKLNVLFIAVDDLRPELGTYGHAMIQSPHIDQLAKTGLQFERAYCQLALCNPSRASLLSGRRPETLKVYDLATFVRDGNPDVVTLPQLFKQHGYRSVGIGKIFHTTNGNHDDPESWSPKPSTKAAAANEKKPATPKKGKTKDHSETLPYDDPDVADDALSDGKIAANAVAALREMKDEPFFLAVGFHKPHLPFVAPKKYWDLYDPRKIQLAPNRFHPKDAPAFASNNSSELRRYKGVPQNGPIPDELAHKLIHGYYASVSFVDAQIGRVLTELDRLGLREKTVVILWSDHGYQLGEHATWNKRTNWEIATRVPLVISAPGQKAKGRKTDALVELVDMYPTLVELCGLPLPPKIEGTSFVPLLENEKRPWKTAAFSVYVNKIPELGPGNAFGRAMRTDRYRFIEWSAPGSDKRVYELYDHKNDPQGNVNVANLPKNKDLVASLTRQLHAGWQSATPAGSGR
ncbi:MAG: sulfatase [Limisphaerales bacterium]